jgi:hypothetical protein
LGHLVSEDINHHGLKDCWQVHQAKEHYHGLEQAFAGFKGGFPLIPFLDLDIIVTLSDIEL